MTRLNNITYINVKQRGFTIIELVTVIVILGILSVTVASKFDKSGFAEYTYQARLISSLRNIQNRAMFDTRQGYCFQINFDTSLPAFGPPSLNYTNGSASDTCSGDIDFNNPDHLTATSGEISEDHVSLSTLGDNNTSFSYIRFDSHGRPSTNNTTCLNSCQVTFSGETSSVNVCIESEGYIHACD